jgi:hypothetical protein
MRAHAAELAQRGVEQLEQRRGAAQARGDQAEVQRLDAAIRMQRDHLEKMQALQAQQLPSGAPELPPGAQAGPPMQ